MSTAVRERRDVTLVSVRQLQQYGESGWQWQVTVHDPGLGEPVSAEFRTNSRGDGLWEWRAGIGDGEWKQTVGTCDFRLPRERPAAYRAIRRAWAPMVWS